VRSFPSFRVQVSFPGLYYAATMDAHVGFESWLERDVAMMLDFDPAVVGFSSQPFWLVWAQDGERRRHVPDYFAHLARLQAQRLGARTPPAARRLPAALAGLKVIPSRVLDRAPVHLLQMYSRS
jgi:hypothetical protein